MDDLRCEKCAEKIVVTGDSDWRFLVSLFPQHLGNCYIHLAAGPSVLPCDRCGHLTRFGVPQLVVGPDAEAVLYIPDDMAAADPVRDAGVLETVSRMRGSADTAGLTVARERKAFRRGFLELFITPMANLANDFAQNRGAVAAWIEQHEARLGEAFFAVQWLCASGAMPVFQAEADTARASSFIPHEEAPPAAEHVVKRHAAQDAIAGRAGEILGCLLACWAVRSLEDRSFDRYRAAAPTLISRLALSEPVRAAAASRIEEYVSQIKLGEQGAIVGQYAFEGVLALLCQAHNEPNPRVSQWTVILILYEYHRRLDENDESMLLPPDVVRSTLDEPVFWSGVRAIGNNIGNLDAVTATRYEHLRDTVARLFPDQARDFSKPEIVPNDEVSDEDLITGLPERMGVVVRQLPQTILLRALLFGLQRRRPHLLEQTIAALATALDQAKVGTEDRLNCWRYGIEALNLAGLYTDSARVANEVEQLLAADPSVPQELRAHLLNEVGNCFRYAGDFAAALQRYDSALECWGRDVEDRDTRVVLRNMAIVLRGMHRYAEARSAFASLRPFAHDLELIGLVSSEALCLSQMGEGRQALALLDSHKPLLERSLAEVDARNCAVLYAQLLWHHGRAAEAKALASNIAAIADRYHDPIAQAAAARVALNAIEDTLPQKERIAQRRNAIATLQAALDSARPIGGMPDVLVGIADDLDDTLVADNRTDEAEPMLRDAWDQAESMHATNAWVLALNAFRHALRRDDEHQATQDLIRGVSLLGGALWQIAENDDPIALLAPNADVVTHLTTRILLDLAPASPVGAAWSRIAADLRAAPFLAPRLRRSVGLPAPVSDAAGEAERLGDLLRETPCTILQIVALVGDVGIFVTGLDKDGIPSSEVRLLEQDHTEVEAIANRLSFALRRASPRASALKLDSVIGWPDLRKRLKDIVADLNGELPLCIVPGPLGSVIPTLALGETYALCFAPSIGALLAMRARRRTLPAGLAWRPRSLFDFATWFEAERAEEAAALAAMFERGAAIAATHALAYSSAIGSAASGDRLQSGLSDADLASIACHGRILPDAEAVDLIVAAEGRLPPNDLSQLLSDRRAPHVLGWREFGSLSSASTVILSSACNSGLAILHPGGERLGLARPLFLAGTLAYVAPQWPVPTVAMQDIATGLLDNWLGKPDQSLATSVFLQRGAAIAAGQPALAAEAFAVFGDGL